MFLEQASKDGVIKTSHDMINNKFPKQNACCNALYVFKRVAIYELFKDNWFFVQLFFYIPLFHYPFRRKLIKASLKTLV